MVNLLVAVGILFIVLAVWQGRNQAVRERQELEELKTVRDDLAEAKKEVSSLLQQLEEVSEKVVEEISIAVEEARRSHTEGTATPQGGQTKDGETAVVGEKDGNTEVSPEPDHKAVLSEDYSDDFNEEEEQSLPQKRKPDTTESGNSNPVGNGIPVYNDPRRTKNKPAATGKTILFPRKMEGASDKQGAGKHSMPVPEAPPKHQMVYAMAKLGYPEEEIAKQMKIGRGEVRLILQLKRKGEEANG